MTTLEEYFSGVPDSATVVTAKYCEPDGSICSDPAQAFNYFTSVYAYLTDCYGPVLHFSSGLHEDGINGRPHWHFHFITGAVYKAETCSNRSNRKRRWFNMLTPRIHETRLGQGFVSFKFAPLDPTVPKWQTLAYPLKEGKRSPFSEMYSMPTNIIDALQSVGQTIYLAAMGHREREERAEIKRQDNLQDLFDFCEQHRDSFSDLHSLCCFLDAAFIKKARIKEGIHGMPDPLNYAKNVKKIAMYYEYIDSFYLIK